MFKNEYTMNRKLIVEYVFKIFGTKTIIRGIFIFILGLLMYLIEGDSLGYVMLTCAIICLFTAVISPIIMIYNIENTSKRINNGKIEKTSVEFDNNIKMNEGKVHLRPLISKTFAFKDYLKAYQYIDDNRETTMKVIINVQEK